MAYVPFVWKDDPTGGTPITASRLNALEGGLSTAASVADNAASAASSAQSSASSALSTATSANGTANAAATAAAAAQSTATAAKTAADAAKQSVSSPNGTVSVKSFGATGDGNTDDTAALQACFNASAYQHIVIPPGNYIISSGLVVPQGVRLFGYKSTLVAQSGNNYRVLTLGNDVKVTGVGIQTKWDTISTTAIWASGVSGVEIRECVINKVAGKGIWLDHCDNFVVSNNNIIQTMEQAIELDYCSYGRIHANRTESNQHGVQYWGGDSGKAADYTAGPQTHHLTITGNVCRNGSAAVSAGIWGSLGRYITISGNVIENMNDIGIDLEGTFDSTVTGNTVNDGGGHCYAVVNGSQRITFSGNVGNSNSGASGFRLDTGVTWGHSDIIVTGNQFRSSGQIISMADNCANRVTITGNYLTGSQAAATWEAIALSRCPETVITNNTIMMGYGRTGISLKGCPNSIIDSNKVLTQSDGSATNSDNAGIFLYSIDANNLTHHTRVRGNTIRGFTKAIYDDNWTTPTQSFNWIDSNLASTVYTRGSSNSVFANNRDENSFAAVSPTTL